MRSALLKPPLKPWIRTGLCVIAIMILALVYVFQRTSIMELLGRWIGVETGDLHSNVIFIINRSLRLIINDLACFILIYALFQERRYLKVAFWLFLIELLIVLPIYFVVKLSVEGDAEISSPLLSFIHRLIVNPTLMILLIGGFLYQKYQRTT